ncbi:hypothetical protein [Crocosphaera chwakensis]|uniref:Uncharacterized protein n=1 Tax=Crocosphaera chwakensis CCY0110 TaxID=391612 RepID=A3ILM1_9CHRO|nr:hypothetical protein [Crocosphaera chwakensis]EAZ92672.1 hypothetical protein CY0110_23936 [Crocosphaera chwakensis CCY0110]
MSHLSNSIKILKLSLASVLISLWGLPSLSQNPQQPNFPGPQIMRDLPGAMRPASDPLQLLQNKEVQQELKLTKDQIQKIERVRTQVQQQLSEFRRGRNSQEDIKRQIEQTKQQIATILQPKQLERFREILLQVNGWTPESPPENLVSIKQDFTSSTLSSPIQLTPEQQENLQDLQQETQKNIGRYFTPPDTNTASSQIRDEEVCHPVNTNRNSIEPILKTYQQQSQTILTNEQQATLEKLEGESFEIADAQCNF